ncbi:hypothetical protein DsansV1_C07g0074481 [Dioscorea sansibarensis]
MEDKKKRDRIPWRRCRRRGRSPGNHRPAVQVPRNGDPNLHIAGIHRSGPHFLASVLLRSQKLIFECEILNDLLSLESLKVTDGSKMMIAS